MKISKARILSNMTNLMNNYKRYVLLFLVGFFISCAGSNMPEQKEQHLPESPHHSTEYSGWGFSVKIPSNIVVNKRIGEDFILYYMFSEISGTNKKWLLGAYAGNYPDYGYGVPKNSKKQSLYIHGLKAKTIRWKDDNNLFNCEVLVEISGNGADDLVMPEYILFWYRGLSDEERKVSEEIIRSVRPVENNSEPSP